MADDEFWCELVLNGIGGRTIAEAKANLTPDEADLWLLYLNKYGSIHIGQRLEYGFALLCSLVSQIAGNKSQMADFMPHHQESVATIEHAMKHWR